MSVSSSSFEGELCVGFLENVDICYVLEAGIASTVIVIISITCKIVRRYMCE